MKEILQELTSPENSADSPHATKQELGATEGPGSDGNTDKAKALESITDGNLQAAGAAHVEPHGLDSTSNEEHQVLLDVLEEASSQGDVAKVEGIATMLKAMSEKEEEKIAQFLELEEQDRQKVDAMLKQSEEFDTGDTTVPNGND